MWRVTTWRASLLVAALLAGAGCAQDPEAARREFLALGDRYLANERYREAILAYRNAVDRNERSGEAWHRLGRAYALAGSGENAVRQLVRAADLLPDDAAVQLDAARALLLAGRYDDAGGRIDRVLDADAGNVDAHVLRANALLGLRDLDGAITSVQRALEVDRTRGATYVDLGILQLGAGQRQEAEAAFKQAIALDRQSVPAHLALANYYWGVGRSDEAERTLASLLQRVPSDVQANQAFAALLILTGRAAAAETHLRTAAADADNLDAQLVLADYYLSQRRPADARPLLAALSNRPQASAAARVRLAGIEYDAGRQAAAHAIVDAVLARDPANAQVIIVKTGWLLREQRLDEADAHAQQAVRVNPGLADAHFMLGSVQLARRDVASAIQAFNRALQLNPRAGNAQIELARASLALGRTEEAMQLAEGAVRNMPTSGAARLMLARTLLATDRVDRAQAAVAPVVEAAPDVAEVQSLLGQIHHRAGRRAAAALAYERALQLDAEDADALAGLVLIHVGERQPARAVERVERQIEQAPDSAPLLLIAARTLASAGNTARAEVLLRQALAVDPGAFAAYRLLGQLYIQQDRLSDARHEYERLAARQPDDIAAHTMVAVMLQVEGDVAGAKARYQRAVELDPRAVVAANNLAYMYAEEGGNLDVALSLAQAAVAAAPDDPDVNDTLGWIYVKRRLPGLAIEPLQRSIARDPSNPLYRYHLGIAYLHAGDAGKAREALEAALGLRLDAADAAEARRALASIQG